MPKGGKGGGQEKWEADNPLYSEELREEQEESAVKIQARARGNAARKKTPSLQDAPPAAKQQEEAATPAPTSPRPHLRLPSPSPAVWKLA